MKKLIRAVIFLALFTGIFLFFDQIFRWKDYYYATYPNTATVAGFYTMEKDTVDVLFFGSSQGTTAFDPQHLYNKYGIRSYNLSTEQQSLAVSYWLLREALRFQKPSAVILDVWMCFGNQNPLNSAEGCVRKVIDEMKWSNVKKAAISDICAVYPELLKESFYLKNIRYHGRWKSLGEGDFSFGQLSEKSKTFGFAPQAIAWKNGDFKPFVVSGEAKAAEMQKNMAMYLKRIADLCAENNISLLLTKTPNRGWNEARHCAMLNFSRENNVAFYDFNEEDLYYSSGYDFAKNGDGHLDNSGAKKVTEAFGEILTFDYLISPAENAQWENRKSWGAHVDRALELSHITDFSVYLDKLGDLVNDDNGFTVFLACKDECTAALNDSLFQKLHDFGLQNDLKGKYRASFFAVKGSVLPKEALSKTKIELSGLLRHDRSSFSIMSAGFSCGNDCSIKIDGREYAKKKRGLNIVVYDALYHRVVDSVCFDTCSGLGCTR